MKVSGKSKWMGRHPGRHTGGGKDLEGHKEVSAPLFINLRCCESSSEDIKEGIKRPSL